LFRYTDHFDFIECSSELESLILESQLIKKHLPPHNIEQTVRKGYTFIKVTKDDYPRIVSTHVKNEMDEAEYIGPFRSSKFVEFLLDKIQRHFRLCPELMKERRTKKGFCFSYQLNLCSGACGSAMHAEEYQNTVRQAADVMRCFVNMENKENIDMLLKSRSAKTPELDGFRRALRRVKKQVKEIPEMFHEKYFIIQEDENTAYFIHNGLLEKTFHGEELDNSELLGQLAGLIQTKSVDDAIALDERLTIQRFVRTNKNKLKIISLHP
jgi:excinuclease UvrABC nuclease subunit